MSARRSLRAVLARQWIAFGLLLAAGFGALALVAAWMLEDAFIDRRLRDVAGGVRSLSSAPALPPGFEAHATASAPPDLHERMRGLAPGAMREFRRADGRYVHVLAMRGADGGDWLLAYDVSDQLWVNTALARAWPWLVAGAALLALLAWALARRFVDGLVRQARGLLERMRGGPDGLEALAGQASIDEFAELAGVAAQAWGERLQALERERETLAFLGHELRTPLQSARTSLALLQDDRDDAAAWSRLQRAHERLARASNAILRLGARDDDEAAPPIDATPLSHALVAEFAPLAATRGQSIALRVEGTPLWNLPLDVAEVVLANLLLNAIRHGGEGTITVRSDASGVEVGNALAEVPETGGFGLGLRVSERLLAPFGWTLSTLRATGGTWRVKAARG